MVRVLHIVQRAPLAAIFQDGCQSNSFNHKTWNIPERLDFKGKTHVLKGREHNGAMNANKRHRYHHDFQDGGHKTSINRKYLYLCQK